MLIVILGTSAAVIIGWLLVLYCECRASLRCATDEIACLKSELEQTGRRKDSAMKLCEQAVKDNGGKCCELAKKHLILSMPPMPMMLNDELSRKMWKLMGYEV